MIINIKNLYCSLLDRINLSKNNLANLEFSQNHDFKKKKKISIPKKEDEILAVFDGLFRRFALIMYAINRISSSLETSTFNKK